MVDKSEKHIHFQSDEGDYFTNYLKAKMSRSNISKGELDTLQACQKLYEEARATITSTTSLTQLDEKTPRSLPKAFDTELKAQAIRKLVNLHYFYNFFQNSKNRNDFKDYFDREHPNLHLDSYPDFDVFAEFYESIYSKNDSKDKVGELIQVSHDKLVHYISGSQNIALRQASYHHIQKTIEKIIVCDFFKTSEPPKVHYQLVKKSTAKLMTAKVDVPFGHHKEQKDATPPKQKPKREEIEEDEKPRDVKFANVDADGFITVQPKKKAPKNPDENEKKGHYRNKEHNKNRKYNKDDDDDYRGSKGGQKYYEKKVYTKKTNPEQTNE